ncbi:MAG: PadR family transcriptional regulator [Vulcanimicrobiaceae bacterium]
MTFESFHAGRHGFEPAAHDWAHGMRAHFMRGRHGRHRLHGFGQSERGSVKYDVLAILADGPRHGYEIMLAIEERRGFRPSPGSIYPALQMLDDGDFVSSREVDGKRVYAITEKGRELLQARRDSPEAADESDGPSAGAQLMLRGMRTLHGLRDAVRQIARSRDEALIGRAVEILDRARRELYALLADAK